MRGEIPSLKRCCFCLPLRPGLLFWGYLKLLVATIFLYPMSLSIVFFLHLMMLGALGYLVNCLLFTILILDFTFNIIFVIAGHMKNHKLFRVYYYYTIAFTIVSVGLSAAFISTAVFKAESRGHNVNFRQMSTLIFWFSVSTFSYVVLQVYIILLVRSEVLKLKNDGQFRFVNNEVEAECRLNINEEDELVKEKAKELNTETGDENKNVKDVSRL